MLPEQSQYLLHSTSTPKNTPKLHFPAHPLEARHTLCRAEHSKPRYSVIWGKALVQLCRNQLGNSLHPWAHLVQLAMEPGNQVMKDPST